MAFKMDIVMCIDITGSMQECIDTIKKHAYNFCPDLQIALNSVSKQVTDIRVKVIGFRDFEADGKKFLEISKFFTLSNSQSDDTKDYEAFVRCLEADGGGDVPNNSLEALSLAIQSDWVQTGDSQRHVILLFTDAPAHKLEEANTSNPYYPANMPKSFDELSNIWKTSSSGQNNSSRIKLKQAAKRLIIFAPEVYPWPDIYESWDYVVFYTTVAGMGIDDVSYNDILNAIVESESFNS